MKHFIFLSILAAAFSSCADEATRKPVGPVSETSRIPWNAPISGQGGGQFSALPQNQIRR
ncbi:hypothetical protein ACFSSA_13305 [Luteolibacter algae]|uniref:Lipoprotein n=1 Tax=Luteolibacter algae TaxID=454151 RepID=A0ABW5DCK8_9BACT